MHRVLVLVLLVVMVPASLFSQSQASAAGTSLPRFVRYSGVLHDAGGQVRSGGVGVTFALYSEEEGGSPLWQETQTVTCDAAGRYTALVGSQSVEGLPLLVFASNEARWLGVIGDDGTEQKRVLLVSVPYALKAGDAETLGGMTASQIMAMAQPLLATATAGPSAPVTPGRPVRTAGPTSSTPAAPGPRGSFYMNGSQQAVVEAYDDGAHTPLQLLLNPLGGNVGVGTTTPGQKLSVAGVVESTVGGFKFPDASVQTTAGMSQTLGDARYLKLTGGTLTGTITANSFVGNAAGLTNLNAGALTGTVAPINLPGSTVGPSLQQIATLNWRPRPEAKTFAVGSQPHALAFDGVNIWVANFSSNDVTKLRATDGALQGTYPVGTNPYGLAFDGTNVWVSNYSSNTVTKLRASDGASLGTFNVGTHPARICFDGANVWVANNGSDNVTELRASDGALQGTFAVGTSPWGMVFDGFYVWVSNAGSDSVTVFDPTDPVSNMETIPVDAQPQDMASDGNNVWVTSFGTTNLSKVNSYLGVLQTYTVGAAASSIAFDGSAMWVVHFDSSGTGNHLRASDGTSISNFYTDVSPSAVIFDGTNIWVANFASDSVSKIPVGNSSFSPSLDGRYLRVASDVDAQGSTDGFQRITGGLSITNLSTSYGYGIFALGNSIGVSGQGLFGVRGDTFNASGAGVEGVSNVQTSGGTGVLGQTISSGGIGVHGESEGLGSTTIGVLGESLNGGIGVSGYGPTGVAGESNTFLNTAVALSGLIHANAGTVLKLNSDSTTADLITGISNKNTPQTVFKVGGAGDVSATSFTGIGSGLTNVNALSVGGVLPANLAKLNATNTFTAKQTINNDLAISGGVTLGGGVLANNVTASNFIQASSLTVNGNPGLQGKTVNISSLGTSFALYVTSEGQAITGVGGNSSGVVGTATSGSAYGVWGSNDNSSGVYGTGNVGVYGQSPNIGVEAYNSNNGHAAYLASGCCGGYFTGNVAVIGTLTKSAGSFKIDHPLDPANKYLSHSFVESPDMKNIYDGIVITDDNGVADVVLPDWFMALNKDFRYQLTVIGVFAQAIIDKEIADGHFRIRTNQPKVKVSWQVTGIRHDAYAVAHPIMVEEEKPANEKGTYMFPELFGQPKEKSQRLVLHPESRAQ